MRNGQKEVTPFQQVVFEALRRIPRGRVTTYKLLADHIGCGSSRAVGQALAANPYAPRIPCHRVIRSDLSIGGYGGATQGSKISDKRTLLHKEGVSFAKGRLADPNLIYRFK